MYTCAAAAAAAAATMPASRRQRLQHHLQPPDDDAEAGQAPPRPQPAGQQVDLHHAQPAGAEAEGPGAVDGEVGGASPQPCCSQWCIQQQQYAIYKVTSLLWQNVLRVAMLT